MKNIKTKCPSCKVMVDTEAKDLNSFTKLNIKCTNCTTVFNLQVTVTKDIKETPEQTLNLFAR